MKHQGQCHCGAIRFEFETNKPLVPRACQCTFCRRHGARTVADPEGSAVLTLGPQTVRYRFGTGVTDFLICGRCGVYVGAIAKIDGPNYATLNLNALEDPRLDLVARPVCYGAESAVARRDRRRANWTPVHIA